MAKIQPSTPLEKEERDYDFSNREKFQKVIQGAQKFKTHAYRLTYVNHADTKKLVVDIRPKDDYYDNSSAIKPWDRSRKMAIELDDGTIINTHQDEYMQLYRHVTEESITAKSEEWVEGHGCVKATFDWEGKEITLPAVLLN